MSFRDQVARLQGLKQRLVVRLPLDVRHVGVVFGALPPLGTTWLTVVQGGPYFPARLAIAGLAVTGGLIQALVLRRSIRQEAKAAEPVRAPSLDRDRGRLAARRDLLGAHASDPSRWAEGYRAAFLDPADGLDASSWEYDADFATGFAQGRERRFYEPEATGAFLEGCSEGAGLVVRSLAASADLPSPTSSTDVSAGGRGLRGPPPAAEVDDPEAGVDDDPGFGLGL